MTAHRPRSGGIALFAAIVVLLAAHAATSAAGEAIPAASFEVAQAGGTEPSELETRYQPAPLPPEKSWYNSSYIFALTRGVAGSTMVPAAKVSLYVLTLPLDVVLLPIAGIGGMFG